MKAILYVCHGSRIKQAAEEARQFIEKFTIQNNAPIQEIGFLELAAPTIEDSFKRCVERGATNITIMPILLLTAAHAKMDIPKEVASISKCFPNISLQYGDPLGVHVKMAEAIYGRIIEKTNEIKDDTAVVIVGRGSSDPDVIRDLNKIKVLLQTNYPVSTVYTCFLTAATPSLEVCLNDLSRSHYQQIIVVPYLLFTGILMKSIQKQIKSLEQATNKDWVITGYLNIILLFIKYC